MYIHCVSKLVTSMLKAGGTYNNHSPLDGVSLFYKNLTYYFKVKERKAVPVHVMKPHGGAEV